MMIYRICIKKGELMRLLDENKFKVACLQTNSTDIPIENINMLEKAFLKLHGKKCRFCLST